VTPADTDPGDLHEELEQAILSALRWRGGEADTIDLIVELAIGPDVLFEAVRQLERRGLLHSSDDMLRLIEGPPPDRGERENQI
jgi:Mn-dependent DtxR family transcriptional regulator